MLSIPVHPELEPADVDRVAHALQVVAEMSAADTEPVARVRGEVAALDAGS